MNSVLFILVVCSLILDLIKGLVYDAIVGSIIGVFIGGFLWALWFTYVANWIEMGKKLSATGKIVAGAPYVTQQVSPR